MCVSASFCEENLPLLLTILANTKDADIRTNIVIALGDVAVSFSTIFEEYVSHLYKCLEDTDLSVKRNTLLVLTHLILNGMVKVKGQLGEMAKSLVDEDPRIRNLGKLFFSELATKDNAVYNNLPDVISHLSMGSSAVSEEKFEKIMRFLFEYVKDRQAESLVDRLCQRFREFDDVRHFRDTAFCLSLIQFRTERSFKKLADGLPLYQDKLFDDTVYKCFTDIVTKARQLKTSRMEIKTSIDEYEMKLKEQRDYFASNAEAIEKAKAVKKNPRKGVTQARVVSADANMSEEVNSSSSTSTSEVENDNITRKPVTRVSKTPRNVAPRGRRGRGGTHGHNARQVRNTKVTMVYLLVCYILYLEQTAFL